MARHRGRERELDITCPDGTTLADVGQAVLGDGDSPALFIDGKLFSVDLPVADAGLHAGGILAVEASAAIAPGVVELRIVAGPGAGMNVRLVPGFHVVGSGPGANVALRAPGVRPRHAVLRISPGGAVHVADGAVSWQPLVPSALLRIGACVLSCVPAAAEVAPLRSVPGRRGTVPFNRPPRRVDRHEAAVVDVPPPDKPPAPRARMGVATLIVPILFGLTMAVVVHPRMALFALLGPVMMVAGRIDDRRRQRKFRRTSVTEAEAAALAVGDAIDRVRVAEVLRRHRTRPTLPDIRARSVGDPRLWERRPAAADYMQLVAGYGRPVWRPHLTGDLAAASAPVRDAIARRRRLPLTAVTLDLPAGQVAGIAGRADEAIELVRSLVVQAAVLHGPADLRIAVATTHPDRWDWAKWLPHAALDGAGERRLLAGTPDEVARLVSLLTPAAPRPQVASLTRGGGQPVLPDTDPLTLLVVDLPDLAAPWLGGLRGLLAGRGGPVAGIVIAATPTELPSVCTSVTVVRGTSVHCAGSDDGEVALVAAGIGEQTARAIARNLARFDDPERREAGAELPASVSLLDLAGVGRPSAGTVAARWRGAGDIPAIAAPIGVTEAGPLVVDLVADGPHALLAGTTGSGKSELLRTLVASLALAVGPEHLNFVLIDYKGGSAFDACAALPHTVGVVTDLDDRLAERALRCLEAELRYREGRLRSHGADDLAAYLAVGGGGPLPRMLIVIDEFAALAKELPDFMDALVDIAARGRSLGVHLLLATQRPAGVIRDNVRANTNLRIALRVQDRADSTDVIGDPGAAVIARGQPGRGFVRLGPGEVVPFQAAQVTGAVRSGDVPAVRARPFRFALEQDPFTAETPGGHGAGRPTELELIVAAAVAAADGLAPPRRPWPEPLPDRVVVAGLPAEAPPRPLAIAVGLRDEPDRQRQSTHWWSPEDGPLALYGLIGSGTTTALTTVATGLARSGLPSELHLYVLDFDTGATAPLTGLPHVGAVVGPLERERQIRLIRRIAAEVDLRKGGTGAFARPGGEPHRPRIVLLVDNFAGFTAAFEAALDTSVRDALGRIITEGPGVGVVVVVTAARTNAVPLALASAIPNKIVFRMADPLAATTLGLRGIPTDLPDGRALDVQSRRELQVALPHEEGLAAAVAGIASEITCSGAGGPRPVEQLPVRVPVVRVAGRFCVDGDEWFVPVGIGDADLDVVGFALAPGDHVYVAGEPRSGKTSILEAIGRMAIASPVAVEVTAVALRPSSLRGLAADAAVVDDPAQLSEVLEQIEVRDGLQLVLVDDADALDDPGTLKRLAVARRPGVHVVAAGRRDVKTHYQHWAKELCRSRIGLWLRPSPGLDGDLWSTPMPRHVPNGLPPGRGYLVTAGTVELVQAAHR